MKTKMSAKRLIREPRTDVTEATKESAASLDEIKELMEKLSASTEKLSKSSIGLEHLTVVLIYLTILLLVITLVGLPADFPIWAKAIALLVLFLILLASLLKKKE